MMKPIRNNKSVWVFAVAVLLLLDSTPASAQDVQQQMILDRLERIERENRELRVTVQVQQQRLDAQQHLPEQPVSFRPTDPLAPGAVAPQSGEKQGQGKEAAGKGDAEAKSESQVKTWEVGSDHKVEGVWNNLTTFETKDKAFRLAIGGVIQFDMGWYSAPDNLVNSIGTFNGLVDPGLAMQDGMDLRRARLRMSGLAFEQIEYFAQYEFASAIDLRQRTLGIPNPAGLANPVLTNFDPSETVFFNEVYVGLVKLPYLGTIRVGRHRESLNFVTATPDNNQVWLERGLLFDAFNGFYNFSNGITVSRTYFDDRAYTLFGLFQQNNSTNRQFASVGDGDYVYDGRVTFLPVDDEEDQVWVHVGADYSYRNLYLDTVRYRGRPNVRVGSSFQVPNIVDTGTFFSPDAQQIANLEFAAACGPLTFCAEATTSWVTNAYTGGLPLPNGVLPPGVVSRGTYRAEGAYVELLYFLTPDHRPYRKERPGYDRVTPHNHFFWLEGDDHHQAFSCGAWEVGVRYDYADLTHGGINGGTAQGVTGCVNWYLSSNTRVQANYSWMHRDFVPTDNAGRVNGDYSVLGIRFNCDF